MRECKKFTKPMGMNVVAVYGGSGVAQQISELNRGTKVGRIPRLNINQYTLCKYFRVPKWFPKQGNLVQANLYFKNTGDVPYYLRNINHHYRVGR